jgi:hypothetical protein
LGPVNVEKSWKQAPGLNIAIQICDNSMWLTWIIWTNDVQKPRMQVTVKAQYTMHTGCSMGTCLLVNQPLGRGQLCDAPRVSGKKTQGTKRRHQPTLNCYTVLPLMALTCINSFPGFTQLPTPFLRQLWVKQLWGTEYD